MEKKYDAGKNFISFSAAGVIYEKALFIRVIFSENARAAVTCLFVLLQHGRHDIKEPTVDTEQVSVTVAFYDPLSAILQVLCKLSQYPQYLLIRPSPVIGYTVKRCPTSPDFIFFLAFQEHR